MSDERPESGDVQRTIDRETAILTSAVSMVASGAARSTTVAGLRLCEAVMAIVQPFATDRGVILEPLWTPDEGGCDVRVRRAAAG